MRKKGTVLTLVFYALIGVVAMSIIYQLSAILADKAKYASYELARANYYRIKAYALYVNETGKNVTLNLDNCEAYGRNETLVVICNNVPYMGKTEIPIGGFGKGRIVLVKTPNGYVRLISESLSNS